jgi:hypothetical protein
MDGMFHLEGFTMKKVSLLFSLLFCVAFSGAALADRDRHSQRMPSAKAGHFTQRTVVDYRRARPAPVIVYRSAPVLVYRSVRPAAYSQPVVIYREPVVVYEEAPIIHEDTPDVSGEARGGGNTAAKIVGAVAGGVIGSRFGGGNGRLAATAAGAVLGSIIADELAQ